MDEHHHQIAEERIFCFERQRVVVDDFPATGLILDIGGGGEGVIGRLKGQQVVAIDSNRRELEEAPPGPLKIVMDGTALCFLDQAFHAATAFYTLMYIKEVEAQRRLFSEVQRVLAPGGRFLIWDAVIPPRPAGEQDIAVFPLAVELPHQEIETGYGTRWPEEGRDVAHYVALAEEAGFEVAARREEGRRFFLELRKV